MAGLFLIAKGQFIVQDYSIGCVFTKQPYLNLFTLFFPLARQQTDRYTMAGGAKTERNYTCSRFNIYFEHKKRPAFRSYTIYLNISAAPIKTTNVLLLSRY